MYCCEGKLKMVKKGTFVAAFSWLLVLASLTMRTANAMPLFLRRLRKLNALSPRSN
jgi:hypothetical protein